MIFEIQIPDEVYEQYGRSKERIQQRLTETADALIDPKLVPFNLSSEQIAELRRHFGPNIQDATSLVNLITKVGSIRLQSGTFQMDSDQIEQTVTQAYFGALAGEPRDRNEEGWTREAHRIVIQRYVQRVLNDAMNIVLGLN